ncbi:MAG: FAD-dependent oxidoreductase, partial [Bacteroidota bacterium]
MTKKEFIQMCGLLGIGMPIFGSCVSSKKKIALQKSDKVIVVGAGAAGLTAAYLLRQRGIDVDILEASSSYGGRMKRDTEFADFPIPMGAEWLHTQKKVLNDIVNQPKLQVEINTQPYDFAVDYALLDGKKVNLKKVGFTIDQKFIGSTWFDFFDQYVVPSIQHKIQFNKVVTAINYTADPILIKAGGEEYSAKIVILTVPVKILQRQAIQFVPSLPQDKAEAIKSVKVWGGCKAFLKFSEKFYPTVTGFEVQPETAGHKLFYDASYGQATTQHILGLFAVGSVATPYLKRKSVDRLDHILAELDQI